MSPEAEHRVSAQEPTLHVRSEFAVIAVSVDRTANSDRLLVRCHPADIEVTLDTMQLEAIARLSNDQLDRVLDALQLTGDQETER